MEENRVGTDDQPAEDTARLEQTADFILRLMQAFLRTGYYLSDHPESIKSKTGLYEKFRTITGDTGEVTFLIKEDAGQKNILVEGVADRPLRLLSIMSRGMADTYNPRFVQFLVRKEILSLSLLTRMDEDEFYRFVDIMSEPAMADMEEQSSRELFVEELRKRRIFNLSFVFQEDFITQRPGIPWRTRMALSRLKKDIHMLPIFRNLSEEEFHRVKMQTLTDILRPLAVPELIYSFLLNIDLVVNQSLSEENGEDGVFSMVSEPVIIAVSRLFLDDASGKGKGFPEHITNTKKARLLAKICQRLNQSHAYQAVELVEEMFNLGLIAMEELHPRLRERILSIKFMTSYLQEPPRYFRALHGITATNQYEPRGNALAKIVPLLVERSKLDEALELIQFFIMHSREGSERSAIALRFLESIAGGRSLPLAANLFLESPKEIRTVIGQIFIQMGKASIPHLIAILSGTNDVWRRKQATEILIALGNDAAFVLMNELQQDKLPADSIPSVLRLLGGSTNEEMKPAFVRVMEKRSIDTVPLIRAEALAALCRLDPSDQFERFRKNLDDADLRVKKSAIRGIGLAGDVDGLRILVDIIEKLQKKGGEDDWALAIVAMDALGSLMDTCPAARTGATSFFAQLTDQATPQSAWKKLVASTAPFPEAALMTLTEILGKISGPDQKRLLTQMAGQKNRLVANRAAELLRQQR